VRSLAVVVPKERAEEVRRRLQTMGVLRQDLRIREVEGRLLLPVIREVDIGYPSEVHEFEEIPRRPRSYKELVEAPEDLRPLLPRSFDIVGDVAIVRLAKELRPYEAAIGSAFLRAYRNVKTVAVDEGVKGALRQRRLRVVAGRKGTRTVHREHGLVLAVDPAVVYFSPRMAGERLRVAQQVQPGEVVVDAFCGVGPFALQMARRGARVVYAIDSNPRAIEFLRENMRLNKVENVVPIQGNADSVLPTLGPADRIVLDFPQDPIPHFPIAVESLKEEGIIHYYEILERAELEDRIEALRGALPPGLRLQVLEVREVRGYSPTQGHFALDLRISRG
jgi:tRNA (guanine37-N1)-methyltransferase